MSIIIKANELNILIYKYFLEAGLSHSAYTLFNEAALAHPLQEFRFDVRAGHLMSILEKGLVYSKIESHVNVSQYMDCEEPFFLLKPHMCKLVEKVRKERTDIMKELEETLNDGLRRTNSIYNTSIVNKEFEEIVYESKGGKYFQKFPKIRLPANESEVQDYSVKFILAGCDQHTLLYNVPDYEVDLLHYDNISQEIKVERIFPSVKEGQLAKSVYEVVNSQYVIQLFDGNHVTLFELKEQQTVPKQFKVPVNQQMTTINVNSNVPQLVSFGNEEYHCIINLNTYKVIKKGEGKLFWKSQDEYLIIVPEKGIIELRNIKDDEVHTSFQSKVDWQDIQFNESKTLFAAISYNELVMHIYTFENNIPLFMFSFEEKTLRQALFVTSNSVDYFCWLTNQKISVFDVSLNAYSKIIEIQQYDTEIRQLCQIRKAERDQMYLLCLGLDNLLIYDLSMSKTERIEIESRVWSLKQLNREQVAMMGESNIHFLVGQYLDPLFK